MSRRRLASLWGPVLLEAALLFYASSMRSAVLPARGWDKVVHFAAYAILCGLLLRALHGGFVPLRLKPALTAVALASLYGASDELHQAFVPGREASLSDLLADALGAVAAAGVLAFALPRNRGRSDAKQPIVSPPTVDPAA